MDFTQEQIAEKAKELRRAYAREYARKNREKCKEQHRRCWERKALAELEKEMKEQEKPD